MRWSLFFSLWLIGSATGSTTPSTEELLAAIQDPDFPTSGVAVEDMILDLEMGELELIDGTVYSIGGYRDSSIEGVFVGSAVFRFKAPDHVEAGQLELFTGADQLEEAITEIAFASTDDELVSAIRSRKEGSVDLTRDQRGIERATRWTQGAERELLHVEVALLHDALGDPAYDGFFAAAFKGDDLGEFLFSIDPSVAEPIVLGQFVRPELTDKEEKKLERALHKAQRQGRFIGVEVEDLGTFDTWVSARRVDRAGIAFGGTPAFTPRHYEMAVDVAKDGRIDVRCKIRLESMTGTGRSVAFELDSNLIVEEVADASGDSLSYQQVGGALFVFLDEPVPQTGDLEVTVRYDGLALDRLAPKSYSLRNTTAWYPRVGLSDLATYDVSFNPPPHNRLIASGRPVGGNRFRLDQAVGDFSFEMGDYEIEYFDVDDVRVTIAWDKVSRMPGDDLEGPIKATIGHALTFYEETLGDYGLDFLTVVTVPRDYAQSLRGFITLPSSLTDRMDVVDQFYTMDPRMIIVHEVAHQWWGHIVRFGSYRDQWISEAMASYSATAWMHATIPPQNRPAVDLTQYWLRHLSKTTALRRSVDSMGPLVLGTRLDSSHYPAYFPIVYKKGAIVLNMLAESFGEKTFLEILEKVVEQGRGKIVTTDALLEMIERITEQELSWFRDRYIYGTGIPRVYYSYQVNEIEAGKWHVSIDLEQESPYIRQFKLMRGDGAWRLEVSTEKVFDTEESVVAIPLQVRVKQQRGEKRKKYKGRTERLNELARVVAGEAMGDERIAEGSIVFRGTADSVSFDLPFEPEAIWLDRRSNVYGRFLDSSRWPRHTLTRHALDAENAGDYDRAAELYRQAIAADYYVPIDADNYDVDDDRDDNEITRMMARLLLARMYLRFGDTDRAAAELDTLETAPRKYRRQLREDMDVVRSRIDLRNGDYRAIMGRLQKRLAGRDRMRSIEGYAVLATAAHELGDDAVYARAAKVAEKNGVDMDALKQLRD